jgi:YD repeat-containing protein
MPSRKPCQKSTGGKTTTRTYDALGRLATYADGEGNTIAYTYDVSNNLASITYPGAGNKTVGYTYDANNRLITVTDWDDRVTHYTYDLAGRLGGTTRPNGTTRSHVYDAAGQLRFIEGEVKRG